MRQGHAAQYLETRKMPMGWVPSPAIAQRTVRVMLAAAGLQWGQDAVCWIDNILVTATTAEELEKKLARFLQVAKALNVTFRTEAKGQVLDYIGLTLDLPNQQYKLQEKFCNKLVLRPGLRGPRCRQPLLQAAAAAGRMLCMVYLVYQAVILGNAPHVTNTLVLYGAEGQRSQAGRVASPYAD